MKQSIKREKKVINDNTYKENKRNIFLVIILILLIIIILMGIYVIYDLNHFEHIQKGKINNIFEVNVKENDNFLFLGDSITEFYSLKDFYENLPVVNSGVGGNTTDDILSDMENRVYQYNPTKVFILIGINDMKEGKDSKYIFDNIVKIVNKIKKNRPKTKIYVESIYPINDSEDSKINPSSLINRSNDKIDEINKMLKKKYKKSKVTYIDVNSKIKKNGQLKLEYTVEGVHLTPLGYINVTRILLPYINE